jgi:NAD(P)-dependent dehydrogenase (short-subunit alcohol dehydrogenase family)
VAKLNSPWTAQQIPSQAGRTALITGANSGIGYQASLELARHGAHVLLGCRSAARGAVALHRLLAAVPGASAEVVELDMASLASIRAFAAAFAARGVPLDLLINNAGVMALPTREVTVDGFERQFGTNHLGHFALTGLLIPQLLAAPAPRVVTVASLAHRNGTMHWDDLQMVHCYTPWDAYNQSKLANILFAKELARRAAVVQSKLISLPVHPGMSRTNIVFKGPGFRDLKSIALVLVAPVLMQSDARGALPTLYAATSPDARSGDYIGPGGWMEFKGPPVVVQPRPQALSDADGQRLWSVSEQLTGVSYPSLA